jgi:hypothetical protein
MRKSSGVLVLAAAAALAVAGCGDRNLVLNVDVLSYVSPDYTTYAFGPIPALPGGVNTGEQPLVGDMLVNLLENVSDIAAVRSVSLSLVTVAADSTGSGSAMLRLYLSDPDTDPMSTQAVMSQPIVLAPGVTDTVTAEFSGDARVVDLFTRRQMRLAITGDFHGPESGAALNGRIRFNRIDAVVVAGRKGL